MVNPGSGTASIDLDLRSIAHTQCPAAQDAAGRPRAMS